MSQVALALGVLIGLQVWLSVCASASLIPESGFSSERRQDYVPGRALLLDSRERRAASSGLGASFIRFGRDGEAAVRAVSQPHTRADTVIRYGRDGLNGRLNRLRQERMRRLARLALICAAKSQEDTPASSAEEKILREICKDAPLHPTVPDFV